MNSANTKHIVRALFVISALRLITADSTGYVHSDQDVKRTFSRDCDTGYSLKCMKLDIVSYVEKLAETDEFSIIPGISVIKDKSANDTTTADIVSDLARSFPNDPDKRLDSFLIHKLTGYLGSHTLRLKLLDSEAVEEARSAFTGRKKGIGGKKGYGGLLAAAMMMKGTLMSIGLGALALLAGKALMTALMALMLSAIIGLKSLTSGGHKQTTYEIVAKPVYSHSHSHSASHEDIHGGHSGGGGGGGGGGGHGGGHTGYGGYGRSLNFALPEHLKN